MSKQKMLAARELIQEKRYAEARALLKTIDDPKAQEWLKKLDEIAPQKKKSGGLLLYITAAVVLLSVVIIAVTLISRQNNANSVNQNAVAQAPTQIELPSVTRTFISVTTVSISLTPTASTSPTFANDDFQERLESGLLRYCFVSIDLMQALDIYRESEGWQPLFPQLVHADVHQLCSEWTQEILLTKYDAAVYCLRQADAEYRETTFYECIDARNFHLGNILGEGWAATASEILEFDQSVKTSLGFSPYTDFRTWEDQVQVSEIRIGSTVVVAAKDGFSVRSGANLDRSILFIAVDGSIFVVEDGPAHSNGLTWWKVRDPQNSSRYGWVTSDYLEVQTNCPQPAGWVTYTVEAGDSMGLLAEQTDSSIAELTQANCLDNPDSIYVGLVLYVPRQR